MPRERRLQSKESPEFRNTNHSSSRPSTKRRKTSQGTQPSPSVPDLIPPPTGGRNDTLIAQNPFDDYHHSAQANNPFEERAPQSNPTGSRMMPNKMPGVGVLHPSPHGSEKVYPINQSMVFNPSNPNAPPIYPCGICHKEVHENDQAILCESGCNFWFHRMCTGLSEGAFHMLRAEVYAEWVCDSCRNSKNIPLVKMKP